MESVFIGAAIMVVVGWVAQAARAKVKIIAETNKNDLYFIFLLKIQTNLHLERILWLQIGSQTKLYVLL